MRRILPIVLLALLPSAIGQKPQLRAGSTVYIAPMQGYENYLAAAFAKKHVPITVITDQSKADYVLLSSLKQSAPASPGVVVNVGDTGSAFDRGFGAGLADHGKTSASVTIIDRASSQVVFAYTVGKGANTNQVQSAAEACAKHLKQFIEGEGK